MTECEWRHAPEACRGLWRIERKLESWVLDAKREGSTFGARGREAKLRPMGTTRDGAKWIRQHRRLCHFNSNLIKRFRTWTTSRYVFSNFEIPLFFIYTCYMFYRYEHYTSISPVSHMALIVNMIHYWTRCLKDKGAHYFPKVISPKVNVIARLEFELAYYNASVQKIIHYATGTAPKFGITDLWRFNAQAVRMIQSIFMQLLIGRFDLFIHRIMPIFVCSVIFVFCFKSLELSGFDKEIAILGTVYNNTSRKRFMPFPRVLVRKWT